MFPMLIIAPLFALASAAAVAPDTTLPAPSAAEPASSARPMPALDPRQRVCLDSIEPGSLLVRRQCQTRAEWRLMGQRSLANAR